MASGKPDYYTSSAMHGQYAGPPARYVTLNVDDLGNMLALMKGEGPGGLDTIALDAGGRIISVIRDPVNDRYISVDADG